MLESRAIARCRLLGHVESFFFKRVMLVVMVGDSVVVSLGPLASRSTSAVCVDRSVRLGFTYVVVTRNSKWLSQLAHCYHDSSLKLVSRGARMEATKAWTMRTARRRHRRVGWTLERRRFGAATFRRVSSRSGIRGKSQIWNWRALAAAFGRHTVVSQQQEPAVHRCLSVTGSLALIRAAIRVPLAFMGRAHCCLPPWLTRSSAARWNILAFCVLKLRTGEIEPVPLMALYDGLRRVAGP